MRACPLIYDDFFYFMLYERLIERKMLRSSWKDLMGDLTFRVFDGSLSSDVKDAINSQRDIVLNKKNDFIEDIHFV